MRSKLASALGKIGIFLACTVGFFLISYIFGSFSREDYKSSYESLSEQYSALESECADLRGEIEVIREERYQEGRDDGYEAGYEEGEASGYKAGKKNAGYDYESGYEAGRIEGTVWGYGEGYRDGMTGAKSAYYLYPEILDEFGLDGEAIGATE